MCGIFGFVDWRSDRIPVDDLKRVTNLLRHRGPDGGGYWTERGAFLGHRRLAIVDLATGDQPMYSGDGRYVLTFNGEIYNYPELRDELRALGVQFRTSSDTEVLLEGYRHWGTEVVGRCDGMFAFGIFDRLARSMFLARDRFGEKPLLYAVSPGRLMFASELAPLVAAGGGERAVDLEALAGYLCLNYVPGARTLMSGIARVAPATWQLHDAPGHVRVERYWDIARCASGIPSLDMEPALDALQACLDDAVTLTLRSDVPVGLFLSGGTDSSLIAESAARQGTLAAAFSVDFAEDGFSEWPLASHVASRIGVEIVRVPLDSRVLTHCVEMAAHLDDPVADSSALAVWTVAEAAARRVKVVLSGDGGDELFGGYLSYATTRLQASVSRCLPPSAWTAAANIAAHVPLGDDQAFGLPYTLRRFLRAMPLSAGAAHLTWNGAWAPAEAARLLADPAAARAATTALADVASVRIVPARPSVLDLQLVDLVEYLPNDILTKVDRATMAHGLESRAPLLNQRVAAFALSLPEHLRTTGRADTKVLIRRLCARHFGEEHATAPKRGFTLPLQRWLRTSGRALMESILDVDRVLATDLLDAERVRQAVGDHVSGRRRLAWGLWGLMVLVSWYEQRVASPPNPRSLPAADDLIPVMAPPVRRD